MIRVIIISPDGKVFIWDNWFLIATGVLAYLVELSLKVYASGSPEPPAWIPSR